MNIYIQVGVVARELDSKLLLALKAAEKGHEVLVGHLSLINPANLLPGIFHTTHITPTAERLQLFQEFKSYRHIITSIDEEHGLTQSNYESFAKTRFSSDSLNLVDAVFCWGNHDYSTLCNMYREHSALFHCTGSPRVDIWKGKYTSCLGTPKDMPEKPYLLISSNFSRLNSSSKPFWKIVKDQRSKGYYDRVIEGDFCDFCRLSEDALYLYEILKTIEYISEIKKELNIVVRPHPTENPELWKELLPLKKNIHIIRTGGITPWLHNAIAVLHNGCTTAFEATISGKPVITYTPTKQKYGGDLVNQLGLRAENKNEVLNFILQLENNRNLDSSIKDKMKADVEYLGGKIKFVDQRLATDEIISIWEDVGSQLECKSNNWHHIKLSSQLMDRLFIFKGIMNSDFRESYINNDKFPPQDLHEWVNKIQSFHEELEMQRQITITTIGRRGVVITPE